MKKYYGIKFDKDGIIGQSGISDEFLLKKLINHKEVDEFLKQLPPKSTGRELFSNKLFEDIFPPNRPLNSANIIATLVDFTIYCFIEGIRSIYAKSGIFDNATLVIAGGGAKNKALMNKLIEQFENLPTEFKLVNFQEFDERVDPDFKEAIAFAYLGFLHLMDLPGNVLFVTGAEKSVVLGKSNPTNSTKMSVHFFHHTQISHLTPGAIFCIFGYWSCQQLYLQFSPSKLCRNWYHLFLPI